jgi:hypothetical protein
MFLFSSARRRNRRAKNDRDRRFFALFYDLRRVGGLPLWDATSEIVVLRGGGENRLDASRFREKLLLTRGVFFDKLNSFSGFWRF